MSDAPFGFDPVEFEYFSQFDSYALKALLETCNKIIGEYTVDRNIITHILISRTVADSKDGEKDG